MGANFRPNKISAKQNFTLVDAKFHQDDSKISLDSTKIHGYLQNFVEFLRGQRIKSTKFRFHFFCPVP